MGPVISDLCNLFRLPPFHSFVYKLLLSLPLSLLPFFFCLTSMACGILVPQPGIEPVPPAVKAQSLNPWTTREVPSLLPFFQNRW